MNARLRALFLPVILITTILACNMPFDQVPAPSEVQTAAALTVQAVMITPSRATATTSAGSATLTKPASLTVTFSATGSPAATKTVTPTYSVPVLTVRESTNCRTGPGEDYDVVVTYLTGKKLEIAGRYDPGNFWLVKSNESPTGTCWLWGEYADVTGSYWTVASVTPPPTETARPPRAPGIIEWNFSCSDSTLTFTVNWADNANNETGYRVFRNGESIVELPANTTTYTDTFAISPDQSVDYYLQVFAPSGTANSSIMRMKC